MRWMLHGEYLLLYLIEHHVYAAKFDVGFGCDDNGGSKEVPIEELVKVVVAKQCSSVLDAPQCTVLCEFGEDFEHDASHGCIR